VFTDIPTLRWTDLPVIPKNSLGYRNRFHALASESSEKFGTTMAVREDHSMAINPEEIGEIVVAGWSTMHIGRSLARVVPMLASIGHHPEQVLIVRANFYGANWHWIDWSEAEALAARHLPMIRFDALYDVNFRGIAGKAMEHCIFEYPNPRKAVQVLLRTARMGTYRPAFVALLEAISRRGSENCPRPDRRSRPGIDTWRHAVGGDDSWMAGLDDGLNSYREADVSIAANVGAARPIIHWVGSGSLPPIIGPAFDTTPYPRQYLAASRAHALDFVSVDSGVPCLTLRGRQFLNLLPTKVRDIDAPIRWHDLKPEDVGRADDWMARHFRMMKRAINEKLPSAAD
jgi:hypothetical protein